ncbi:MAG: helix-turn-helix domain-containing protein [Lachnospiraceae bacterium]|nr:helix-turn-helix domain-containing protein [Lachnospiraceae bacterium]MBQ6637139.1 helix-turn-helix domain-containing protein [Lachnospiraceae bacterium]MBR3638318.1 helix-turn-helix domain-containing protein [Lachnospiraceae bacterium]
MISSQILQNSIDGMKNISRMDLCVTDTEGKVVATTTSFQTNYTRAVEEFVKSPADSQEIQSNQFFKIYDEQQLEYIVICSGVGENTYVVGKMAAFQIQSLVVAYKERFDKDNFVKNLLLDNLLLVDIYGRAKRLRIQTDVRRVCLIVENDNGRDINCLDQVKDYLGNDKREFVTAVDENNVVVIKDLTAEENESEDIEKLANNIVNYLKREGMNNIKIAYGTPVNEIKDVSRSYKEAKMALDVGKIFFDDRNVIAYGQLGIGRLIYQLPIPLCKMFIKEILDGKSMDDIDEETLTTINKFFENSLNVSETSRQLFIHRNTLVYRLDKLQKTTGLDLRVFEDAITFRIALMVKRYMKYMENAEY